MNKQEKEELAIYISERMGGEEFNPDNIKTLGNWVLIKEEDYGGDWECNAYDASQGMSWECWDMIPMDKSPFETQDADTLRFSLNALNANYSSYLKEIKRDDLLEFFTEVTQ